ncbi:MAG: MBL fold metallo-hydrolase [Myxococcales bacterium]|nr:MBL fold metallo-hydrolase [Myxococcales bacterium]MDH3484869.1 MBL fold metallo-hydrolase [Myxococcales bacterium]
MPPLITIAIGVAVVLGACAEKKQAPTYEGGDLPPDVAGNTSPSATTAALNAAVAENLPLSDQQDFEDAKRGLIASDPELRVSTAEGTQIWNMPGYDFINGDVPVSVNPSLWRQERLNDIHGLFEVTNGVYQLRGYDLANMSLIEGKTGWIVVDPLTAKETGAKAMAFAREQLGERPVSAVIYTHSHVDHFGGVLGVISPEEVEERSVPIIAPEFFLEEATSENVIAGVAMARRSLFMFGPRLPRGERGHVGSGLGKEPAYGTFGLLPPSKIVTKTGTEMTIDGVNFIFQNAPGSEAPAELTFYLPDSKTFCGAEVVSHTMHNLYTLRGAKVRDAVKWSGYIDEVIEMFPDVEVYFGSHHWPIWGNDRVIDFLEKQRDTYKYINDQTLRLALHGATPREIAEELELPESLKASFANRGYYGTLKHNAKAVYQRYFGWYDGNPANLDPLPPAEAGAKYVELAGGAANLLEKAQAAYDKGEYRWVAEVVNHLVFADPNNQDARDLLAQTYDQLGYQAESGPWRDVYLTGAFELRHGGPTEGIDLAASMDMIKYAPLESFLTAMASRLNAPKAKGKDMIVNLIFTDLGETYVLELKNSVLRHYKRDPHPDANVSMKITHELYLKMLTGQAGLKDTLFSDDLDIDGSRLDLVSFFRLIDKPTGTFNIVTP